MMLLKTSLLLLGLAAAGLNCYGAFEQGLLLDKGSMSYMTIAAPVIAFGALFIPYFAECAWKAGQPIKTLLWVLVLVPTVATVFYAGAERVHNAKAGLIAENRAQAIAVSRAEKTLDELKEARNRAEKAAADGRKFSKNCSDACVRRLDEAFNQAVERVTQGEKKVRDIQAAVISASPLTMPIWLMPVALDLIAFAAMWSGLAIPSTPPSAAVVRRRRAAARKPRTPPKQPAPPVPMRPRVIS